MTIVLYPNRDGYWRAEIGNEELVVGQGTIEYSTYDEDGTLDENRFIGLGKEAATLLEYREALRANCAGLYEMPDGLRAFVTEAWKRAER